MDEHRLSLRDLLTEEATLLAAIIETEGEILPEIENALKASEFQILQKIDNYSKVMERLELEAKYRAQKADKEMIIQKRCKMIVERMKESIKQSMIRYQKKELKGYETRFILTQGRLKVSLRPDVPESMVPSSLKSIRVEETLNKELILKKRTEDPIRMESMFNFEPSYSLREYPNIKSRKELADGDHEVLEPGPKGTEVTL